MTAFPGYTINDVLGTDIDDLHEVLLANAKPEEEEQVVDLLDFVKAREHK